MFLTVACNEGDEDTCVEFVDGCWLHLWVNSCWVVGGCLFCGVVWSYNVSSNLRCFFGDNVAKRIGRTCQWRSWGAFGGFHWGCYRGPVFFLLLVNWDNYKRLLLWSFGLWWHCWGLLPQGWVHVGCARGIFGWCRGTPQHDPKLPNLVFLDQLNHSTICWDPLHIRLWILTLFMWVVLGVVLARGGDR